MQFHMTLHKNISKFEQVYSYFTLMQFGHNGFNKFDFIIYYRISIFQIIDPCWMICGNTLDVLDSLGDVQNSLFVV